MYIYSYVYTFPNSPHVVGVGFQSCWGNTIVAPLGSIVAKVYLCGRARWSTGEVSQ